VDVVNEPDPNGQPRGVGFDQEPQKALVKAEPVPQLVPSRKADLERQHRATDLAQAAIERHYRRLGRSLKSRRSVKASEQDWARWDRELTADFDGLLERIVELEGGLYAMRLGGGEFDMRRVQNYLRAMAEGAAGALNEKIRAEVDEFGVEGALSRRGRHIESAGAGLGASAVTWARMEAARQAPGTDQRVKIWIANSERHAEFAGLTVPLGADWPSGFAPGSAPGCHCTMAIQ
jgi:hypothetical protein